jgi:hypothetical protein
MRVVRGHRVPALTLAYAAALLGTNVWLELAPAGTEDRVLHDTSTNLAHLIHDPWLVLPASALFTRGGLVYALIGCALCLAPLELVEGPRRALLIGLAGHVIGTLVSEAVVAIRIAVGDAPETARHALDVGPSYVLVAAAAAVIASTRADLRLRLVCALAVAPVFVYTAWRLPDGRIDAIGHLTAGLVGVASAVWLRPRPAPNRGLGVAADARGVG